MKTLAVIGMGYVGLPVAVSFAQVREVIGFDIANQRISELQSGRDRTGEVSTAELVHNVGLSFTMNVSDLVRAQDFIVCVPTPIDPEKKPDLSPLVAATWTVGKAMQRGALVVFESTVYPGVTEDVCIPILEEASGLRLNLDFWVGYSPERINPGDSKHRFENIVKVVSGSSEHALNLVDDLYSMVVTAGTHRAPNIKVAEAAKVIENTQRDLNIALINELSKIFNLLEIDTQEVLSAASTKWNFLPFQPGLVGGHCIGVDPYYLTHRAQKVGYIPEVILAGREMNDSMGAYVVERVIKLLESRVLPKGKKPKVLVLGATFKENCHDMRNSRVIDIIQSLNQHSFSAYVADPWVLENERFQLEGVEWITMGDLFGSQLAKSPTQFSAIIIAVAHEEIVSLGGELRSLLHPNGILFDVKGSLAKDLVDGRL